MAYNWTKDEEITAAKLNAMQQWPNMSVVNRSGVGIGGIDGSVLSEEVLDSDEDPNPVIEDTPMKEVTEHETGNFHYENNDERKIRQLKTNVAGVTGKENYSAQMPKWFCCDTKVPKDGKAYIWEKITTTSFGQITGVTRCINQFATKDTDLWDPVSNKAGVVWKRIGTIGQSQDFTPLPKGPGQSDKAMPWSYCVVNENNTTLLPIARRWGWVSADNSIDLGNAEDVKDRGSSSKWAPTVLEDNHLSTPIQGVGELGGTFVYNTYDCGSSVSNRVGIGIASGVEFYDWVTEKECYNCHEMRPKSTRACASIGYGGSVAIENINKKHPWQFKLSTTPIHIDIGTDFGTTANAVPAYDLPDESYLTWGVVPDYGSESLRTGLMTGKVRRLTDGLICEGDSGEWHQCKQYAVGEIRDGVLGIRTATWRDPMGAGSSATTFGWNRQGGVVVGIVQDPGSCHYKPYIDKDGMIHVAESNVKTAAGQRIIKETVTNNITSFVNGGGGYKPLDTASIDRTVKGSLVTNDMLLHAPLVNKPGRTSYVWNYGDPEIDHNCCRSGILNGEVLGLTGGLICTDAKATTPSRTYRVGEIECGKLGIAYSHYAWRQLPDPPTGSITGFPTDWLCYNPGGGLIRKIEWDSHCRQRPQIIDGIIKFPGKEWNTENQVVCASAQLYSGNGLSGATGGYPVYEWPVINNDSWAKCGTELNTGGKVTGEVVVLKHRGEISSIFEEASALSGHAYKSPELGEVYKGQIGISTAFFQPYMQPSLMEEEGQRELGTRVILDAIKDRDIEKYSYTWNAGVVRGVVSDINWNRYYYTKEMCYVGEDSDGTGLNPPDCVYYVRFLPFIMPHIDRDGLIHLPKFDFIAEKHVFSCAGSSSQCIKFIGTKPYAESKFDDYLEPEDFPIINPEDPGSEFEPTPPPPDIGSIVDYGTIIEDEE